MHSAHPDAPRSEPDCDEEVGFRQRFGGAIIDEDGHEIPITEDMIQAACEALERQSFIGLHGRPEH